ncbi:hypothetical protein PCE31107_02039 [Pandoraea cepalis]|uniref:Uncharacterized protein n=1 Tax=Pandoraea cepalis TaxID=2508294 RepID=A0A5E4UHG2_9BURK|nr:hypothetical protein PCE31107_02039 [Pandoraea cepalis]
MNDAACAESRLFAADPPPIRSTVQGLNGAMAHRRRQARTASGRWVDVVQEVQDFATERLVAGIEMRNHRRMVVVAHL